MLGMVNPVAASSARSSTGRSGPSAAVVAADGPPGLAPGPAVPGVAAGGLGADGEHAGVGYPEATMAVRAFLPERMFVTGASPMTLTRASRRESRQNPGGGGANARPGTWGAGRALKPRIARSRAGPGVDVKGSEGVYCG